MLFKLSWFCFKNGLKKYLIVLHGKNYKIKSEMQITYLDTFFFGLIFKIRLIA